MVTTAPNRERKTAIIVGASRGLGLGLAREFARRGWQVTATARTASSVKELAGIFAASGEKTVVEQVDIDLPDSVNSLATRVGDRRFDLAAGHVEVEQDRAPAVLPHHAELARPAAHGSPCRGRVDRRDDDQDRSESRERTRHAQL